jgi:hypothetical protein
VRLLRSANAARRKDKMKSKHPPARLTCPWDFGPLIT